MKQTNKLVSLFLSLLLALSSFLVFFPIERVQAQSPNTLAKVRAIGYQALFHILDTNGGRGKNPLINGTSRNYFINIREYSLDNQYVFCIEPGIEDIEGEPYTISDTAWSTGNTLSEEELKRLSVAGYVLLYQGNWSEKARAFYQAWIWHHLSNGNTISNRMIKGDVTTSDYTEITNEMLDAWQRVDNALANLNKNIFPTEPIVLTAGVPYTIQYDASLYPDLHLRKSTVNGLQVTVENGVITLLATNETTDGQLKFSKLPRAWALVDLKFYNSPVSQDMVGAGYADPLNEPVLITVQKPASKIAIHKTADILTRYETINGHVNPIYEEGLLEGAVFGIYSHNQVIKPNGVIVPAEQEIARVTTSKEVAAESEPLPLGDYYLRELESPTGYLRYTEDIPVSITQDNLNTVIPVNVKNERIRSEVNSKKVFEFSDLYEGYQVEALKDTEFTIYNLDPITSQNGEIIPANSVMQVIKTSELEAEDQEVNLVVEDLPFGRYKLVETKTHPAYIPVEKEFTVERVGTEVKETLDLGQLENTFKRYSIEITKQDEVDSKPLEGVPFNLYAIMEDGTEKLVREYKTDKNGRIVAENLIMGEYEFREMEAPEGYRLDPEATHKAVFSSQDENGTRRKILVENERIPEIQTTATADGEKETVADLKETVTLTDTVKYKDLKPGQEYTATVTWQDKETKQPLTCDGQPVSATITFTPTEPNGEYEVSTEIKTSCITETKDIVAFEDVYRDGRKVATHADLEDEGQTVKLLKPKVETNAFFEGGSKSTKAEKGVELFDEIKYENLPLNRVVITMVKLTDLDDNNKVIFESTEEFTPTEYSGTHRVSLKDLDLSERHGHRLVITETFKDKVTDKEIAKHEDLTDKKQTVKVQPKSLLKTGVGTYTELIMIASGVALSAAIIGLFVVSKNKKEDK